MKYLLIFSFCLLIIPKLNAQPKTLFDSTLVRPIVLEYVELIRELGGNSEGKKGCIYKSKGLTGATAKQYQTYEKLNEIATEAEWWAFLNHHYPEMRYYAFISLVNRGVNKFTLIERELNDIDEVVLLDGCVGWNGKMIDLYLREFWFSLNDEEQKLVTLLCLEKIEKEIGIETLMRTRPRKDLYSMIQTKVDETSNPIMTMLLFRYRKPNDELLLDKAMNDIFFKNSATLSKDISTQLMTDLLFYPKKEAFKPTLEKIMTKYLKDELWVNKPSFCTLLAQYEDEWAANQLLKALEIKKQSISSAMYHSIERHIIPQYSELFFKLWEYRCYGESIEMLYKIDKQRTLKLIDLTLETLNERGFRNDRFIAGMVNYKTLTEGVEWKYKYIETLLNSEDYKSRKLAVQIGHQSTEKELIPLYLNCLKTFPTDEYSVYSMIDIVNRLDTSKESDLIIKDWYEANKKKVNELYPTIHERLVAFKIIEK